MTQHEHPMPGQRLAKLDHFDDYQEAGVPERSWVESLDEANLISSLMEARHEGDPWHRPILDLDVPAKLVPSSTPGHAHLYIDVPMPWDHYRKLLEVLAEVGILEEGYVSASTAAAREATFVRLPWVRKGDE